MGGQRREDLRTALWHLEGLSCEGGAAKTLTHLDQCYPHGSVGQYITRYTTKKRYRS